MISIPDVQILPLKADAPGVIRVGGTRVTLDTIVEVFNDGASAEEISHRYPVVSLADVYAVIGYYLHNKPEVDAYLAERAATRTRIREEHERRYPPYGLRERLLARRKASE